MQFDAATAATTWRWPVWCFGMHGRVSNVVVVPGERRSSGDNRRGVMREGKWVHGTLVLHSADGPVMCM